MSSLTNAEYDFRKQFLSDLKAISKTEAQKVFEIIKHNKVEYSENSNGIFFDMTKVNTEAFKELTAYIQFCKKIREEQSIRDENERIAQENLQ
jgi:hypothetical protein